MTDEAIVTPSNQTAAVGGGGIAAMLNPSDAQFREYWSAYGAVKAAAEQGYHKPYCNENDDARLHEAFERGFYDAVDHLRAPKLSPASALVERLRIMAKQCLSTEMDDEDQERADWQGAYDWFCEESRWLLAALQQAEAGDE